MGVIDIDSLLAPVAPDKPSGDDLEYDPAFREIEAAAQGKPERRMGESVIPGEEPNWKDVKAKALAFLKRSKDLRAAVHLNAALLRTDGFAGFADGLALVRGLVEKHWDTVYPPLEDGSDATFRLNSLMALGSADAMIRSVRESVLAASRAHGRATLRDVLIATGRIPRPSDGAVPDATTIQAVFRGCDADQLLQTAQAIDRGVADIQGLGAALSAHGGNVLPGLTDLSALMKSAQQVVRERLAERGLGAAPAAAAEVETTGAAATNGPVAARAGAAVDGPIASREQALLLLDRIADYFAQHEPSSPVPILLKRARRLVSKSFIDIVKDLAPDGLAQVEKIRGEEQES